MSDEARLHQWATDTAKALLRGPMALQRTFRALLDAHEAGRREGVAAAIAWLQQQCAAGATCGHVDDHYSEATGALLPPQPQAGTLWTSKGGDLPPGATLRASNAPPDTERAAAFQPQAGERCQHRNTTMTIGGSVDCDDCGHPNVGTSLGAPPAAQPSGVVEPVVAGAPSWWEALAFPAAQPAAPQGGPTADQWQRALELLDRWRDQSITIATFLREVRP